MKTSKREISEIMQGKRLEKIDWENREDWMENGRRKRLRHLQFAD